MPLLDAIKQIGIDRALNLSGLSVGLQNDIKNNLLVNKEAQGYEEYRLVKAAEPFPYGLKQDRYVVCFWSRS